MTSFKLKSWFRRLDVFDALALGLLACLLVLALAHWDDFPISRDIYYHMGTTKGFAQAGGIALHDFWEFAPAGRAHLYPPLLHVIMFGMNWLGLSAGTVGRLVSFSAFYLVLASIWFTMRRLFGSRTAFYSTVLLCSCFMFFWQTAVTSAASLVLVLAPLAYLAFEERRSVAACVLLTLALYSHLVLGHLMALGLFIYALHRREYLRRAIGVLAAAYVLWLPWGIHILANYKYLDLSSPMGGSEGMTVHLLLWGAAIAGFVICYFKKGRYYLLPSVLLAMVPILFFYPHRFWDGHVFVPLAMLGGVALSSLHGLVREAVGKAGASRAAGTALAAAVMVVPVALVLFLDPVVSTRGGPGGRRTGAGQSAAGQGAGQMPIPPGGGQMLPQQGTGQVMPQQGTGQIMPQQGGGPANGPVGGQGPVGLPAGPPPGGPDGGVLGSHGPRGLVRFEPSTLLHLVSDDGDRRGPGGQSLSKDPILDGDTEALAELIKANSDPNDIVSAGDPSLGNLLTALTGLPSTGGMFKEVQSEQKGANSSKGTLVVVKSGASAIGPGPPGQQGMMPPTGGGRGVYGSRVTGEQKDLESLELIGSVEGYSLYRDPDGEKATGVRGTVVPWYVVFPLLLLALAAVAVDWLRPLEARGLRGPRRWRGEHREWI